MNIKELRDKLSEQAFNLEKAKSRGMMVNQETERMRNLLVNNLDGIMEALDYAVGAEEKIERLTVEVESADAELLDKDDEIAELKAKLEKPAKKAKAKEPADVE